MTINRINTATELRRIVQSLLIALVVAGFSWVGAAYLPWLQSLENLSRDLRMLFLSRDGASVGDNIVVLAISEATLAKLPYRSPVNRDFLADGIAAVLAAKPAALAVDILFDQPTVPESDERLRSLLTDGAADTIVTVAYATRRDGLTDRQQAYLDEFTRTLQRGHAVLPTSPGDAVVRRLPTHRDGTQPLSAVATGTRSHGGHLAYMQESTGRPLTFKTYPFEAATILPKPWLAGKTVFIGAMLPMDDLFATPFTAVLGPDEGRLPGVLVHAHAASQLASGKTFFETSALDDWSISAALTGLAVLIFSLPSGVWARLGFVTCLAGAYGVGVLAAYTKGWMLPLVAPEVGSLIAAGVLSAWEWNREHKARAFLRRAFEKYVSPKVVDMLAKQPYKLVLGGERREVTYLFTDLAGFTSLTEQADPAVLGDVLGRYMDGLTGLAIDHGATLDKIIGDAMVCFFGAPLEQPDHACAALQLARAIDAYGEDFRRNELGRSGLTVGVTRIGVHSGPAVIGNFGGQRFFDYTGLGDTVNTAARLESLNKHLGTRLAVSGATVSACRETEAGDLIPLGRFAVKGKTQALEIFSTAAAAGLDEPQDISEYRLAYDLLDKFPDQAARAFADLADRLGDKGRLAAFHYGRLAAGDGGTLVTMTEK